MRWTPSFQKDMGREARSRCAISLGQRLHEEGKIAKMSFKYAIFHALDSLTLHTDKDLLRADELSSSGTRQLRATTRRLVRATSYIRAHYHYLPLPMTTKTLRSVRTLGASFLMLAMIALSFPTASFAQTADPAPTDPAPTETPADPAPDTTPAPLNCENGQVPNETGDACVDPAPAPDPIECTDGQVLNDDGTACVDAPAPQAARFSAPQQDVVAPEQPYEDTTNDGVCYAVSDSGTDVGGNPATATFEHSGWTHALDGDHGAEWIWNAFHVTNPGADETLVFTKTISLVNASPATLELASDNEYTVLVNGNPTTCDGTSANNFGAVESCAINLNAGENTLTFTVKNDAVSGETNPEANPAGLIYKVTATQAECGKPKEEPKNSCVAPTGSVDHISYTDIQSEDNLQEALDSDGYTGTDATADQTNTQTWDGTNNTVNFTAKFLEKNASYHHVFGYYMNGNLASFVPLFDDASAAANSTYSFSVPNVSAPGVGFAIKAYNNAALVGTWATQKSLNSDSNNHAIVFNPSDDTYVLAFDDQTGNTVDHDYNDILVEVSVDGCTDAPTCNPEQELLQNGSFANPSVSSGSWNLFASGSAGGWLAEWLGAPVGGRPATANIEIQNALSGWTATGADTQWTELDSDWSTGNPGHPSSVGLYQDVTTIPGKTYTFSFDFSPRPGTASAENKAQAYANGQLIGTAGPAAGGGNTSWTSQSFSFVATTTTTRFEMKDAGTPNDSYGALVDNASLRCTPTHETPHEVTIVSSKIVCTNEADLPNWGNGGHGPITATTADAWVSSHPSCHLTDDWHFEVANQNGGDPGKAFVGDAGAPYTDFGPTVHGYATTTVSTTGVTEFHLREVLKNGYIPFTYGPDHQQNNDNVSAEFYCSNDVLNYDNWDYIRNPVDGATYYCVAWNVQKPGQCNPDAQTVLLSSDNNDGTLLTTDETGPASLVTFIHSAWVHTIDALWIWKDPTTSPADAANGTTETFTRTFTITGTPMDASLDLAVDNSVVVKVNGNVIPTGSEPEHNYEATTTYAIPAADMHTGLNTITFKVTNLDHATANDPENNPAGLLYKLTTNDNQCGETVPASFKVHIRKYLDNGDGGVAQIGNDDGVDTIFPMKAEYDIAGIGPSPVGGDSYNLGDGQGSLNDGFDYSATTIDLHPGDDYGTHEVTGGTSPVVGPEEKCSEGKYELEGYQWGDTLAEAEDAPLSTASPYFTNLTNAKYVIVVNKACGNDNGGGDDTGANLTIIKDSEGGIGTFSFQVTGDEFGTSTSITTVPDTETSGEGDVTIHLDDGEYDVNELSQEGWTLQGVQCEYEGESEGTPIAGGEHIYVEDGNDISCVFTNTKNGVETETNETIVVRLADLFSGSIPDALSSGKWFEYNDSTDVIDNTLGSFVTGPSGQPFGDGSIEFSLAPNPNDRKDIATYQFEGTSLADITSLGFSAYSHSGVAGANESPYLVFNVDFTGSSSSFQKRLVYVPANNGSVPQDSWNTYDAINGGNAMWVYSGANWPAGTVSNGSILGTTARSWGDILADYPNARVLPLGGLMGVRVGEPGPDGYTGDVDAFVIGIHSGTNTNTTTYDFEPDQAPGGSDLPKHHSSRGGSGGGNTQGEVLGATTCGPLLNDYLKLGWNNNPEEVKKLQDFLNSQLGMSLPVTGFFGPMTFDAVKLFQKNYWESVLKPWFGQPGSGISGADTPTGFVYQTTKWEINNIWCPGSESFPSALN